MVEETLDISLLYKNSMKMRMTFLSNYFYSLLTQCGLAL